MSTPAGQYASMRVHIALLVVQLAFGLFHVVAKYLLSNLHPVALAGMIAHLWLGERAGSGALIGGSSSCSASPGSRPSRPHREPP